MGRHLVYDTELSWWIFCYTGEEDKDKRKKSVVVAYTISLILTIIRHSTDMSVMETFGARLMTLSEEGTYNIDITSSLYFS
jgi:hypothetical protein